MNLVDLFGEFPDILLGVVDLRVGQVDLVGSLLGHALVQRVDLG